MTIGTHTPGEEVAEEEPVHVARKSSFTLDGNSPFDFGHFGRFDVETMPTKRMESVGSVGVSVGPRHRANAASFTLDMFDEHDPFDSWDAGVVDGAGGVSVGVSECGVEMDCVRWGLSKLSVAEMSPTLDGCSDDELDAESLAFRLQQLTNRTSRERIKRMVSL